MCKTTSRLSTKSWSKIKLESRWHGTRFRVRAICPYLDASLTPIANINPALRVAPASSEFEKIAADFFGGKMVSLNYEKKPSPSPTSTKTYITTYNATRFSDEVWDECKENPALAIFLMDVILCNDMEEHRAKSKPVNWLGDGRVHLFKIGTHSGEAELKAMLNVLNLGSKTQSVMEEGNDSGTLNLSSFTIFTEGGSATQSDDAPDVDIDSDTSTLAQPGPTSHPERENKQQNDEEESLNLGKPEERSNKQNNDEEDDKWMKSSEDHEFEKIPKTSSKKRRRNRNKNHDNIRKKKPFKASSTLGAEPEQESTMSEKEEVLANDNISEPSSNLDYLSLDEKSGDWSVVQNRVIPKQIRPLNNSSTIAIHSGRRSQSGAQSSQSSPHPHKVSDYSVTRYAPS
jgi:hypothetical protein